MAFGIPWWVYFILAGVVYGMYLLSSSNSTPTAPTPVNASRSFWENLKLKAKFWKSNN